MRKNSQSLLDFINVLPLQGINIRRAPISNKEAETLMSIWHANKDEYGKFIVPQDVDPIQVASLTTKGMLRSLAGKHAFISESMPRTVEITDKGKQIIRNIVLYNENNAFSRKDNKFLDYETIHAATYKETKHAGKTASTPLQTSRLNWLQKLEQRWK
jgi:hypothetical protein